MGWQIGKYIGGFVDRDGYGADVHTMIELSDGHILAVGGDGGGDSVMHEYKMDEDGTWRHQKIIRDVIINYDEEGLFYTMAKLPNGNVLLGGTELYMCKKDVDDEWRLVPLVGDGMLITDMISLSDNSVLVAEYGLSKITLDEDGNYKSMNTLLYPWDGIDIDADDPSATIECICEMPNGNILIGGDYGLLRECRPDENGKWEVGPNISGLEAYYNHTSRVTAIARMSNDKMLIGSLRGLYEYTPDTDGEWRLGPKIAGLTGDNDIKDNIIDNITQLPDGNMLVGTRSGIYYEYGPDEGGEWKLAPRFKDFDDSDIAAKAIGLSDVGVMIGGEGGALFEARKVPVTVGALRNYINKY